MLQVLGSKGHYSRSRTAGPTCWKMHFFALLTQYLENQGWNFTKLCPVGNNDFSIFLYPLLLLLLLLLLGSIAESMQ